MDTIDFDNILIPQLGVGKTEYFSAMYPVMNHFIFNEAPKQESRNGMVSEILNFKTIIKNPYRRLVGGYKRDENVFFLLAEAVWIFTGRKDVKFLTNFNAKMSDFSDDGEVFHAPYGFRMRHWGVASESKYTEENMHASQGFDQLADAIKIFSTDKDSRQVVIQVWNPELDLGSKSKDLPCNDTVMYKIRNGKLNTTVLNRSNDLHWGLPTNVFQFSFFSECLANCLGIELGNQVHNSDSLHVYDWNATAKVMDEFYLRKLANTQAGVETDIRELYEVSNEVRMDFNFEHDVPANRLRELDYHMNIFVSNLNDIKNNFGANALEVESLEKFSKYLYISYRLCEIYIHYKMHIEVVNSLSTEKEERESNLTFFRHDAIASIQSLVLGYPDFVNSDIVVMAQNFFASRIKDYQHEYIGTL